MSITPTAERVPSPNPATSKKAEPFLKWAGGKQAIAAQLARYFPGDFGTYFEPFIGGGSVFLQTSPQRSKVSDLNAWLVDTYVAVRDDWQAVAKVLSALPNTREDFLRIRKMQPSTLDLTTRAAHFIYLNKTCFRGLFRVNKKNEFNVPYGAYDRRYFDPANLEAVSKAFKQTEIRHGDFECWLGEAKEGDFVYLDPPYYKLGGFSDFNRYTSGQFREADQMRLASLCRELDAKGVRWAQSNSDTPLIRNLYEGFRIEEVVNRREINLNSKNRTITELLVLNY